MLFLTDIINCTLLRTMSETTILIMVSECSDLIYAKTDLIIIIINILILIIILSLLLLLLAGPLGMTTRQTDRQTFFNML